MKTRSKRALAASFVVTITAAAGGSGCKKTGGTEPEPPDDRLASVWSNPQGKCFVSFPESCPKGASCNPPPPPEVDCPPDHRDASAPAPTVTRRPAGKEDWLRVKPKLYVGKTCTFIPEYFCAPQGKKGGCGDNSASQPVGCAFLPDSDAGADSGAPGYVVVPPGRYKIDAFVYMDVNGKCHKVPSLECRATDPCEPPDGDPVACPPH